MLGFDAHLETKTEEYMGVGNDTEIEKSYEEIDLELIAWRDQFPEKSIKYKILNHLCKHGIDEAVKNI